MEVMQYYIVEGEKLCFVALSNDNCRIIGFQSKSKHERIADSRASITIYKTGTLGGNQIPMVMLISWNRKKK